MLRPGFGRGCCRKRHRWDQGLAGGVVVVVVVVVVVEVEVAVAVAVAVAVEVAVVVVGQQQC